MTYHFAAAVTCNGPHDRRRRPACRYERESADESVLVFAVRPPDDRRLIAARCRATRHWYPRCLVSRVLLAVHPRARPAPSGQNPYRGTYLSPCPRLPSAVL